MGIGSVLKAGIKALPEDTVVPAQSVPNLLKKQGVKDEEIAFSGVELPKEGKVNKADLEKMESERLDIFNVEEVQNYNWVSLKPGRNNPTYKEKVTTYSDKGAKPNDLQGDKEQYFRLLDTDEDQANEFLLSMESKYGKSGNELLEAVDSDTSSRYTSSHFGEIPNYLMHSRVYDDTLDGVPTRVIQEIQSDLHQAGRTYGYANQAVSQEQAQEILNRLNQAVEDGDYRTVRDAIKTEYNIVDDSVLDTLHDHQDIATFASDAAPKSPFEKTWLRKGMEREISDAIDEGRGQIAIPISGAVGDLKRAPGVQKWYETTVASTAQKLAKSSGMDFEMKTVGKTTEPVTDEQINLAYDAYNAFERDDLIGADRILAQLPNNMRAIANDVFERGEGTRALQAELRASGGDEAITYAVIKPREGTNANFSLYASPAGAAIMGYQMLKEGYEQEELEQTLIGEGYTPGEVQEIMGLTQTVAQMKAEGYTDEDIKPLLEEQEVQVDDTSGAPIAELEPPTPNRFTAAYADLMGAEDMGVKELVAKMETVYPDNSFVTTNIAGFFGDKEAQRISDASVEAQRNRIIAEAQKRGLNLSFEGGEWYAQTEEGPVIVTPEWYRAFWESKGEFVLGFTGGMFAARQAMKMAPGGFKGKLLAGVGIMGVTAISAVAGTELDYLHSAMTLQQDFEGEAMARKAMTATELSVIGDAVAIGLIKVAGKSWNGMKNVVDLVRQGALDRAGTALKETFFLTDESADEMVKRLSRVAKVPGKTDVDKAITATALTKPGGEELVSASVHADPRASRAVVKAIDDRAKDLLSSTQSLEGEDVGRFLRDEFEGYNAAVRDNFERVKAQASAAPRGNNFRFDYDKLALNPVLDRLMGNIENKDLAFKFAKQSQKIRNMSKSRRLGDLVELRKLVNEFRYNKRISNSKDYEMLDEIRGGIDKAIQQGAYATMENPQRWLSEWKTANKQYSEMKVLNKNALSRVLMRPGVSEKVIGQALAKYAPAVDGTFVEVMTKLPPKTRIRTEGAVLNNLAEKYTAGSVGGIRATNFPELMKELDQITFTTPEARSMKKAINELSQVFMNDVPLSQASGGIQVTKFAQALTVDPVAKAKFAMSSHMFHYVRSLAPTAAGRASALINKTAKLLENPTDSKTIKELQEMLDGEVNISAEVEELAKAVTLQKASGGGMPRVKLYGNGKVLVGKGAGKEHSIAMHRIATTERIKEIAEATGINLADRKALDIELRNQGYLAVQLGAEKVRLISE